MKIRDVILAESLPLPPIGDLAYQYVIAGNGLFIRAEDSRMEAMAPAALAYVHGLERVEPYARLKVPRVPIKFLLAIYQSARRHLPDEAMYQMVWESGEWHCAMPHGVASQAALEFEDQSLAVIDIHSHGAQAAFFSETDDSDEQGLRFYVVIGRVDTAEPQIAIRAGVYGHHQNVPMDSLFDGVSFAFVTVDPEVEMVLAEDENE